MLNETEKQLVEKISQLNDVKWYINLYEPKAGILKHWLMFYISWKEVNNMLVKTTTLNNQIDLGYNYDYWYCLHCL